MRVLILDHRPGCTPIQPCASCRVLNHLRNSMTPEAMEKYETLLSEATEDLPDPNAKEVLLSKPVNSLNGRFTKGILGKLREIGIVTVGDLVNVSRTELHEKGVTNYTIGRLERALERSGLVFKV